MNLREKAYRTLRDIGVSGPYDERTQVLTHRDIRNILGLCTTDAIFDLSTRSPKLVEPIEHFKRKIGINPVLTIVSNFAYHLTSGEIYDLGRSKPQSRAL